MPVLVRIPTPLRSLTKGQAEVQVAAGAQGFDFADKAAALRIQHQVETARDPLVQHAAV